MSRRNLALITVLFFVLVATFVLIFFQLNKPKSLALIPDKSFEDADVNGVKINLSPNPVTISTSRSASLDVILKSDSKIDKQVLIQIELAFDPLLINSINALPGRDLSNPELLLINIDYNIGRVSYALRGYLSNQTSNIVATIPFNTAAYTLGKDYEVKLMPKTSVKIDGKIQDLSDLPEAKILLPTPQPYFFPAASPSAIRMQ